MRSFSTILATASLLVSSVYADVPDPDTDAIEQTALKGATCMTKNQAQQVADNFQQLIAAYSDKAADQTLTKGFNDYSDSVTTLIDNACAAGPQALGSVTFNSRVSFEKGQGAQPAIPFQQLNVWNNCNTVFLRWRSALTPEHVTGIIVLEAVPNSLGAKQPWLIDTVYSEFNSGAWLVDLNVLKPSNCSSS
ncbi:Hypothetical protein R9X50_00190300 [Acrodontium crateriforme]|uniref:NTF2-like domain-containing protein n=1 Tax=Acrodontium crateriforme TaxID=150365 RepID=A0AAQ3M055_9PEZI|nr:Hypothetical protein R9X50_00190300 [Acrodontium crateriforme]